MPVFGLAEAIHAEARSSFMPRDKQHEYIQMLSVVLQCRAGYPPRPGSIGRKTTRACLAKARSLKAAIEASRAL